MGVWDAKFYVLKVPPMKWVDTEQEAKTILDRELAEAWRKYNARIDRIRAREARATAYAQSIPSWEKLDNWLSTRANRALVNELGDSFTPEDIVKRFSKKTLLRVPGCGKRTADEIDCVLKHYHGLTLTA